MLGYHVSTCHNCRLVEQDIRGVKPVSIVSRSYKFVQCETKPSVVSGIRRRYSPRLCEKFRTASIENYARANCPPAHFLGVLWKSCG